jgi:hypothetical protein
MRTKKFLEKSLKTFEKNQKIYFEESFSNKLEKKL